MTITFVNATIVTVDVERNVLYDAALAVDGDRIAAIGTTEAVLAAHPGADLIDLSGKVLLPGLINCHAHLTLSVNRGITEDLSYPPEIRQPPMSEISSRPRTPRRWHSSALWKP